MQDKAQISTARGQSLNPKTYRVESAVLGKEAASPLSPPARGYEGAL